MPDEQVVFGFEEFWPKVYGAYRSALEAVADDLQLAVEMFNAAQAKMSQPLERAVYLLVSMTATGLHELLILAGNGAGVGAMKISRGMFESAVMAEYLSRNGSEVDDYHEYGRVLMWKRVQQYPEGFTAEKIREVEDEYNRVKPRFTNKNGTVRNRWNKNSIYSMACTMGREKQYELPYSIAASMHHSNFEAMLSHIKGKGNTLSVEELPSMKWVMQALISGHVYLLQALETLQERAEALSLAPESEDHAEPVRQMLFKTKSGRPYRALFAIREQEAISIQVLPASCRSRKAYRGRASPCSPASLSCRA